jgi:hypothetical protein
LAYLDFVPISSTAVSTRSAATLIEPFGKKRWSTHQIRLYLTTSPCLNHTKFASAFERAPSMFRLRTPLEPLLHSGRVLYLAAISDTWVLPAQLRAR